MKRRSLLRRMYRFTWRYKMTPAGKVLTGVIGVASVGTVTVEAPVYLVCCVMLGMLLAAEFFGLLVKPSLLVSAEWPATLSVGEETSVPVRLSSRSRWRTAFDLMLMLPERPSGLEHVNADAFLAKLRPGETMDVPLVVRPLRRGRLRVEGVDAHSTFPFNLIRVPGGRTGPAAFVALPAYRPLMRLDLPVDQAAAAGQLVLSGAAGESTEYLGNRDYSPGEPVRRLDFRAWARLGRPVVKEYQDEHASRIGLLVDTLTAKGKEAARRTEAAVSLAAAVADAAVGDDFQIGLLATGSDLYRLSAGGDATGDLLERLATAVPTEVPAYDAMLGPLLAAAEETAALVVVLGTVDGPRRALLRGLSEEGPPLKVVVVEGALAVDAASLPGDDVAVVPLADVEAGLVAAL